MIFALVTPQNRNDGILFRDSDSSTVSTADLSAALTGSTAATTAPTTGGSAVEAPSQHITASREFTICKHVSFVTALNILLTVITMKFCYPSFAMKNCLHISRPTEGPD